MTSRVDHERVCAPLLDADDPALFPKLTEAQMELLAGRGEVRPTAVGDVLFREGDQSYDVMVVLEGRVSVIVESGEQVGARLSARAPGI
jgi:thioredoxin reductase (NADPH)